MYMRRFDGPIQRLLNLMGCLPGRPHLACVTSDTPQSPGRRRRYLYGSWQEAVNITTPPRSRRLGSPGANLAAI